MNARILAYHRISDEAAPELATWSVRPAVFRRQMLLLKRLGYTGVPVNALINALEHGHPPGKLVGLSFDDGYRDTVEQACPILADVGFSASVYVVPSAVGGESGWESVGAPAPLAGWDELRRLIDAGWEVGMHSRSHPPHFDQLTGPELEREVRDGLQHIEEQLNIAVETFAFPHGHFSQEAMALVEQTGYRAALTTAPGNVNAQTPRFCLPRYEIKRRDTLAEFAFLMLTGIALRRRATLRRLRPETLKTAFGVVARQPAGAPVDAPGRDAV